MPEENEPVANSIEAQEAVTAAFDSVSAISNAILDPLDAEIGETIEFKADQTDRNYRHIEVMMEQDWFVETATPAQRELLSSAALSGKTYFEANSSAI